MADTELRFPRRKKGGRYHSLESPFPIPIQTLTSKTADARRWYYYYGTFRDDHVVVERFGDLTFLYRLGFFGKGILSRSKPQFEKFGDTFEEECKERFLRSRHLNDAARERRKHLFDGIHRERARQHLLWQEETLNVSDMEANDEIAMTDLDNKEKSDENMLPQQCEDLGMYFEDDTIEEYSTEGEEDMTSLIPVTEMINTQEFKSDTKVEEPPIPTLDSDVEEALKSNVMVKEEMLELEDEASETEATIEGNVAHTHEEDSDEIPKKKVKLDDPYKIYEFLQLTLEEVKFED